MKCVASYYKSKNCPIVINTTLILMAHNPSLQNALPASSLSSIYYYIPELFTQKTLPVAELVALEVD